MLSLSPLSLSLSLRDSSDYNNLYDLTSMEASPMLNLHLHILTSEKPLYSYSFDKISQHDSMTERVRSKQGNRYSCIHNKRWSSRSTVSNQCRQRPLWNRHRSTAISNHNTESVTPLKFSGAIFQIHYLLSTIVNTNLSSLIIL